MPRFNRSPPRRNFDERVATTVGKSDCCRPWRRDWRSQLAQLNESAFAQVQAAFLEHQMLFFRDQAYRHEEISESDAGRLRHMPAEHPVVRTHLETRRKGLFVNSHFTASIKGMKFVESAALLNFLYRHIELPDFTCRFRWQNNSVAVWDNRCTQRRAVADNSAAERRLERVTSNGDQPF
jgi:taurine dioxygenase